MKGSSLPLSTPRVGGRSEKRDAAFRAYAAPCLGVRGADNHKAEWAQGQQLRSDRELKNEGLTEQKEGKEASGGISHSREHMLREDKGDRKQSGASASQHQ